MTYIIAYVVTLVIFLAIDFIWLGRIAASFYKRQMGSLMADPVKRHCIAYFYLLYVAGIVYFAVAPALAAGSLMPAAVNGAVFGFLAYATYAIANIAAVRDWPVKMSLIDMAWGTVLTKVSAVSGTAVTMFLL